MQSESLELSLDYIPTSSFEMASFVIGDLDMIAKIWFYSDKCGLREVTKLEEKFNEDLKKSRYKTKVSIWKYIKETDETPNKK